MMNIAKGIIEFNKSLEFNGNLPDGFKIINPFKENNEALIVMEKFYNKFYADNNLRNFIIGINPGRHGAAITGIPFTDTKRLEKDCKIPFYSNSSHEISSVFIYDMINKYGGVNDFYSKYFINSPFPLAIVKELKDGKIKNANYYDDKELYKSLEEFMINCLREFSQMGINKENVFILGSKNYKFINELNKKDKIFKDLNILEHPRYIQQYKSKEKDKYIDKYINLFNNI